MAVKDVDTERSQYKLHVLHDAIYRGVINTYNHLFASKALTSYVMDM